jgi:hypothetical protein
MAFAPLATADPTSAQEVRTKVGRRQVGAVDGNAGP